MMGVSLFTLAAGALWLYALYLALTRTKSPTARGVALTILLAAAGLYAKGLAESGGGNRYAFEASESHELGGVRVLEVNLMNAEITLAPGPARLELRKKAKSPRDLLRARIMVEEEGGRLRITDPRQPKGSLYQIKLTLPEPVAATLRFTNGTFTAEDTLSALDLSATNASIELKDFAPELPSRISATNSWVVLLDYAPQAPLKISVTNGSVRVRPRLPVHVRVNLVNGWARYPGGVAKGKRPFEWGDPQAPELRISATNGKVVIEEEEP